MAPPVRPRVLVTRQLPGEALDRLGRHVELQVWEDELPPPRETLLELVRGMDGLITLLTDRVDAPLLASAPSLRAVSNVAVGYDNIDVRACTARRIPVGNTPGVLTETTADFAFALLMGLARRVAEPLPLDSPLLQVPNLLIAPHIASASHATRGRMASMAADNLLAALEGRRPPHCVNPELFP